MREWLPLYPHIGPAQAAGLNFSLLVFTTNTGAVSASV